MASDVRLCFRVNLGSEHPCGLRPESLAVLRSAATLVVADSVALPTRASVLTLRALRSALPSGLSVLLASRADLALAAGLDGVVLRPDDMTPSDARRCLGPSSTIGVMLSEPSHADELYRWRADFACVGEPPPGPGRGAGPPSPERLSRTAFRVRLAAPGTAIICEAPADLRLAELIRAGADGFMVALPEASSLDERAAAELRIRIESALPPRRTA